MITASRELAPAGLMIADRLGFTRSQWFSQSRRNTRVSSWSARWALRPSDVIVVQRTMRSLQGVYQALLVVWRSSRRAYALALPARHWSHGMFQSPSPSIPGRVPPTVLTTSTMSPRLTWS